MSDNDLLTLAVKKRRTFAIISHPDAGKTTLTEKLLLFGGAIQMAGTVKARKSGKFATSDWLDIEKILLRQGAKLDVEYIRSWLLQFADALEKPTLVAQFEGLLIIP
jgi:hypothetical protein